MFPFLLSGDYKDHSRSLLMNVDSNIFAHCNAKISNFIGGKRADFALKKIIENKGAEEKETSETCRVLLSRAIFRYSNC